MRQGGYKPSCSGQATVEFVIALITVLALFAGILQVVSLARARTDAMVEARRSAGESAILPGGTPDPGARYIRDWLVGPDGARHTGDDTYTAGNPIGFYDLIVNRTAPEPEQWDIVDSVNGNDISILHSSYDPAAVFGMVRGEAARNVPLIPAVRQLLYRADEIDIETEVWMTLTGNYY